MNLPQGQSANEPVSGSRNNDEALSPEVRENLPTDLLLANRVDQICDEFEQKWQGGLHPSIEEYLHETGLPLETLLIHLVEVEVEYRKKNGEQPEISEYIQRFPKFKTALEQLTTLPAFKRPSAATQAPGTLFNNRYRLELLLGSGSFGVVWKALDTTLQKHVAVKIGRGHSSTDQEKMFRKEAQAVAGLQHANIVEVIDYNIVDSTPYIVFKLHEGPNLARCIANGTVNHEQALDLLISLVGGLAQAHAKGIIHRDIKSSNILMGHDLVPRLADFGLARHGDATSTLIQSGDLAGTIPYMAPEVLRGGKATESSDLYAMGVILYHVLTGTLPFTGTTAELMDKVPKVAPVSPKVLQPEVDDRLAAICLKALSKHPANRYRSAEEFLADLKSLRLGETIVARPLTFEEKLLEQGWTRKRLALSAGFGALLVSLVGWGAVTLFPYGPPGTLPAPVTPVHPATPVEVTTVFKTIPPGAKLAIVPVDQRTGWLQPDQLINPDGVSPVTLKLMSGDYLVVAALDDGRFHEVYRHVPHPDEGMPMGFNHMFFDRDRNQNIVYPREIEIPKLSVTDGMVSIPGHQNYLVAPIPGTALPRKAPISDFFVDSHEFTQGEHYRLFQQTPENFKAIVTTGEQDSEFDLSLDQAMERAELAGKRLLTAEEFQYIATNRGTTKYPGGDTWNPDPAQDLTRDTPPIRGLCSGVAEWTDSRPVVRDPATNRFEVPGVLRDFFIVKGGGNQATRDPAIMIEEERAPTAFLPLPRSTLEKGLGTRFARSARPRMKPEDFTPVPAVQ